MIYVNGASPAPAPAKTTSLLTSATVANSSSMQQAAATTAAAAATALLQKGNDKQHTAQRAKTRCADRRAGLGAERGVVGGWVLSLERLRVAACRLARAVVCSSRSCCSCSLSFAVHAKCWIICCEIFLVAHVSVSPGAPHKIVNDGKGIEIL